MIVMLAAAGLIALLFRASPATAVGGALMRSGVVAVISILGVSWLLPPYTWTFDARAVDATSAISIDGACLRGKCEEDPVLGYEFFKRFAGLFHERLHAARLQLLDLYHPEPTISARPEPAGGQAPRGFTP